MPDDNQIQGANEFMRRNLGSEVDAAAAAAGFRVLQPGDKGPDDSKPWIELPGRGQRDLADFAHDMGAVMARAPVFRRGG